MRRMLPACALLCLLALGPHHALGDAPDVPAGPDQRIDRVLALGPLPLAPELVRDSAKTDQLRRALVAQQSRIGPPRAGQRIQLFGQDLRWLAIDPARASASTSRALWLWWWQLDTDRYVDGHLHVDALVEPSAWQEGLPVKLDEQRVALQLPSGSHAFWLLHEGRDQAQVPALRWQGKQAHDRVRSHVDPARRVSARQLSHAETVTRLALSPDGRRLALAFRSRDDSADLDLQRLEIRDLEGNRVAEHWPEARSGELAWSPDGRWLAQRVDQQLWLRDRDGGAPRLLLAAKEHLGAWRWHPDSGSILFLWTQPPEDGDAKVRRLRSLEDRWKTFRENAQLYQVDVGSGLLRPLTALDRSVTLHDIEPAGDRVLLSQRLQDYTEPPHALFRLFELSLADLEARDIARLRQLGGAAFADQRGYWLLAGPTLAQGDGSVLVEGRIGNDYDGQLYRLDADGKRAASVSRDFDPAIGGLQRLPGGDLLLPVTEGDRALLYRYQVATGQFLRLDTGVEVVEGFAVADGPGAQLAVYGTDAHSPQRVHLVDPQGNSQRLLLDSRASEYRDTVLGDVRPWRFRNRHGDEIDGRYYLPPGFRGDGPRHPLIVYYYGGTTPVNRQFTGRYPFHLWAANGYVVYVLQPRGTIGYGQQVSSLHVNAWGRHAADDIIDGTRAFLDAHEFVDPARVGNIGASYGGFMTMYVATRSDLFAASISHAGISNLSGYWGQGWWGYAYSGVASRGSFPWNNRELYVEQSPVFSANRITTPLLLLTGDADTNVPPGESHTMYTALTLLGREVELVEVPGQDHHIIDREQRHAWWDQILAWFDRWLKDEPQWWHALHPETAPKIAAD